MLSWSSDLGAVNATDTIYYLWNTARTQNAHMHKGTGWKGWCEFSLADRFLTVNYCTSTSIQSSKLTREDFSEIHSVMTCTSLMKQAAIQKGMKFAYINMELSVIFCLFYCELHGIKLQDFLKMYIFIIWKNCFFSFSFILPITDPFLTWFQWIEP